MLTAQEVLESARYAMVDGNIARAPIAARVVGQWLDVLEEALEPTGSPRVDVWCDGWYKECAPHGLRLGYSFRAVIDGTVFPAERGVIALPSSQRQPTNVAEYIALIRGLQWVKANNFCGNVVAHTDSQTVWGQITQAWNTNAHKFPQIGHLWAEASQLLDEVDGRLVKEPRDFVKALLGH